MKEEDKHQKDPEKDLEKKSSEVEEAKKYSEILSSIFNEGERIYKIKKRAMFLSACKAGREIGFSYILICTLYFLMDGSFSESVIYRMFGASYPLGFILVVLGKSTLFTEQTSVLALPVLNFQRTILELLLIWGMVILGNIFGGIVFVLSIGSLASYLRIFDQTIMVELGIHVINESYWVLLSSGIFGGLLMGLLTWLLTSTTNTLIRIIITTIVTGTIGFVGFHHSIVGNIEASGAFLYSDAISITVCLSFLLLTLLGNGIGGAIVVGLFKYRIFASNYSSD